MRRQVTTALLAGLCLLGFAGSAQARQVQPYYYSGTSFATGGNSAKAIAFDAKNQKVLVVSSSGGGNSVYKFTAAGIPDGFSGLGGVTALPLPADDSFNFSVGLAVDDSAGDFYLSSLSGQRIYGYAPGGLSLAGYPTTFAYQVCTVAVSPDGKLWIGSRGVYAEYNASLAPTGRSLSSPGIDLGQCGIGFDSAGNAYAVRGVARYASGDPRVEKFDSSLSDQGTFSPGAPLISVDRADDTVFALAGNQVTQYDSSGKPLNSFGGADPAHFNYAGLSGSVGLAVNPQDGDVYVARGSTVDVFSPAPSVTVPDATTGAASGITATGATLNGTVNADNVATTDCHVEWGKTTSYGNSSPCLVSGTPTNVFTGSADNAVAASLGGLIKGTTYHYRLVAKNANNVLSYGRDRTFNAAAPPSLSGIGVDHITTDSARVNLGVNANGGSTSYRVEVGTDTNYGANFPVPDAAPLPLQSNQKDPIHVGQTLFTLLATQSFSQGLSGLSPATTYHYRVIATNPAGTTTGSDHTFITFAAPSQAPDSCDNALARQQSGSSGLLDCRAYELVSAPYTGGYDVRSDLIPDGAPLSTSPDATDAALYSMVSGTIPGVAGNPTNRGADPYLATRGPDGWSTEYVGLSAINPNATGPFASPLLGADESLDTFAFAGADICNPCFDDGSTNVPIRLPDGTLVKGMAGTQDPGPSSQAGTVREPLSGDGSHFVFGSDATYEDTANSSGTDATIYSRDLSSNTTEVVSTDETGTAIANGDNIAELAVSHDGTRTLIGKQVATDAAGNHLYHLYLHVAGNPASIDLMPGASQGAIYDGMDSQGQMVYLTTKEALTTAQDQDTDSSADLYRTDIDVNSMSSTLIRVSAVSGAGAGGAGDTNACSPFANSVHAHWNSLAASANCDVLGIAGAGGVAPSSGAIYFFSPEQIDGSKGTAGAPNLYLDQPGSSPQFVTTLEAATSGPQPPAQRYAQTTSSFPAFAKATGVAVEHSTGNVYVLDAQVGQLKKYNANGSQVAFTAGGGAGTNHLNGSDAPTGSFSESSASNLPAQIAVDQSNGRIYVPDYNHNVVDYFASTGAYVGQLSAVAPGANTATPAGVAVNPTNGNVYVANKTANAISVFSSAGAAVSSFSTSAKAPSPTAVAVDSSGDVYVANGSLTAVYDATGTYLTTLDSNPSASVAVDPSNDDVFVNEGTRFRQFEFRQFDSTAIPKPTSPYGNGDPVGNGTLTASIGLAVDSGKVYASNNGTAVTKFALVLDASPYVDSPLLLSGLGNADSAHPEQFQTTASGDDAVFLSTAPLTNFDSAGKEEVYRFDAADGVDCVSCSPTGAQPSADVTLSPNGSSLTEDGRAFFTTADPLVLRDSNEKRDAYEWEDGTQQLISAGTSPYDSSLLSVSSNGKDAFFFTRDALVQGDANGSKVRLYDAREDGGFAHGPPDFQCAASDECHGAGTKAPADLQAGTTAGGPGNCNSAVDQCSPATPLKPCRKGKVRRHGRCVSRHPHKSHKHKARHHRRAGAGRGGVK